MRKIDNPSDVEICQFDGVSSAAVYVGSFPHLYYASDKLTWRVSEEGSKMSYDPYKILTLAEVSEQLRDKTPIITVFDVGPMAGVIYQWGNYGDVWYQIGETDGYA